MRARRGDTPVANDVGPRDDVRNAIETLAERVDLLATMVRETSGNLVASRGALASLETSVRAQLQEENQRAGAELRLLRRELETLRSHAAQPATPAHVAASPHDDARLRETVSVLADRVKSLSGLVGGTASRVAAGEGALASLRDALAAGDARVDRALAEIRSELESVSALAQRAATQARPPKLDASFESRVGGRVDSLAERVNGLAESVKATAGRLTVTDSRLAQSNTRSVALEQRIEERAAEAKAAAAALRRDVDALSARLAVDPTLRERVDRLAGAVQTLDERTDTVFGIVRTTSGRIAGHEGKVAALERQLSQVGERIDAVAHELREEIELLGATAPGANASSAPDARLEQRLETIGTHLAQLEGTVVDAAGATERIGVDLRSELSTAASAWAEERAELAARIEAIAATAASGADVERLVAELGGRLQHLEQARHAAAADLAPADTWRAKLTALETRIDEVSAAAGTAARAAWADERVAIEARIGEIAAAATAGSRVEQLVAELAGRLEQLERSREAAAHDGVLTETWRAELAALETRIVELAATVSDTAARGDHEVERTLQTLAERLEQIERDRRTVAADAGRAERAWAAERAQIEARLDAIAASASAGSEVERLVVELARRLDRMEHARETAADLVALAQTWRAELATLEARVDESMSTLGEGTAADALRPAVAELTARIEGMERDRDAIAAELARSTSAWSRERAALQERVGELAASIVTGPVAAPAEGIPSAAELVHAKQLDQLRIGVEGLRMRLASQEKAVAELTDSSSVSKRLDELSGRLDQLQAVVATAMPGASSGGSQVPLPTGGSRVPLPTGEMQHLLRRVRQTERLSRAERDAFLTQVERMASRVDWRLQRLEAASAASGALT